jgi:hypothetical protein
VPETPAPSTLEQRVAVLVGEHQAELEQLIPRHSMAASSAASANAAPHAPQARPSPQIVARNRTADRASTASLHM